MIEFLKKFQKPAVRELKDAEDTRVNILRECSICHETFSILNVPAIKTGIILMSIEAEFKNHNWFRHGSLGNLIRKK